MTYVEMTLGLKSGFVWTMERLNTLCESHKMFRMSAPLFHKLHDLLVSTYGQEPFVHMISLESLGIFLLVCGHMVCP